MRKLLALLALLPTPLFAQAHPRAVLRSNIETRLEAKAAGSDADWVSMKSLCDYYTQQSATADSLPPVYAPNQPVVSQPAGTITQGYQGGDYVLILQSLGPCYYGLKDSDALQAAKYKAQAMKIVLAAAAPFASVTPAAPPANWDGLTVRASNLVTNTGPGGQARITMYSHGLSTNAAVTIAGVLGCTAANITGKVGAVTSLTFDLLTTGGSPVICNAAGTNYAQNILTDSGYGSRNYILTYALGYDWFQSSWTAGEKAQIFEAGNFWADEVKHLWRVSGFGNPALQDVQSNYHGGHSQSLALWGICTRGAGENSRGQEWYDYWSNTLLPIETAFFSRWLGNNAGTVDTTHYGRGWIGAVALPMLVDYEANGVNHFPANPWVLQTMRYMIHNTMPPRTYQTLRGYVTAPGDSLNGNIPSRTYSDPWWLVHHIADVLGDSFRPYFKDWIADVEPFANNAKSFFSGARYDTKAVWWDSSLSSSEWTVEPLSNPEMSNPSGGYGTVLMRSDWTTGAVAGNFSSHPYTASVWNGKEMWDEGSLLVQRGDVHLLVHGEAEATRAGSFNTWLDLLCCGTPSHLVQGIYLVKNASTGVYTSMSVDYSYVYQQPGFDRPLNSPPVVTTTHTTRIDRYADATSYVYSRAVNLNNNYGYMSSPYHRPVQGWDREVLYLRPGRFVIYDRTLKVNHVSASFDQQMRWVTGRTATTASYGSGMYRTSVVDGATYKGALTHVLPAIDSPTVTNYLGLGAVYTIDAVPSANNQYVNWLTVVDPAAESGELAEVAKFTSANADVVRLNDDTVVGFASNQWGAAVALPITYTVSGLGAGATHRIAGLAVSTTYNVTVAGANVTIATSGGGSSIASTASGVLVFTSGSVPNDPVSITTTNLPNGTVGAAYSQTLGVTGGDGGPYTCALDSGVAPTGLTLNAACTITGTPTLAETQTFAVKATDGSAAVSAARTLSITVIANAPVIMNVALPAGVVNQPYAVQFTNSGGSAPFVWDLVAGTVPSGLSLSSSGVLSGTPLSSSTSEIVVRVTDNLAQTDSNPYTLQVIDAPTSLALDIKVERQATRIHVKYGKLGLPYSTPCSATLYYQGIAGAMSQSPTGYSTRQAYFSGLLPDTIYTVVTGCGSAYPDVWTQVKTLPGEIPTGTISYPVLFKPSTFLTAQGVAKVSVTATEQPCGDVVQSLNTSCAAGCVIPLTLKRGRYFQLEYHWETAGNTAVGGGVTRVIATE